MAAAVELQVCIRCRPFSQKDKLGVLIVRNGDTDEMALVNLEQEREIATDRFAFNQAWWSAYNYDKFLYSDPEHMEKCANLQIISQNDVFQKL